MHKHRAPMSKRRAILALTAALALVAGVLFVSGGHNAAGPVGSQQVAGTAPGNVCVGGLPDADGNYTMQCHQDPASPSSSPTAGPTTPPATTPPTTTPPATTPPATTPPPTSTPPSGPLTGCIAHPGVCGYPDASSTGTPAGIALKTFTGTITAGTTYDGYAFGCLSFKAANVTIRNSSVRCANNSYAIDSLDTSGTFTIEHTTIVCTGGSGGTAIGEDHVAARWVDISNCENGADANNVFSIRDSYIHDMLKNPNLHTDGIQVWPGATNIVFVHNTVLMHNQGGGQNSAFTSGGPGGGPQGHFVVTDDILDFGNYIVYWSGNAGVLANNRFGNLGSPGNAPFGYCDGCGTATKSGNVLDSTGAALAV
jgi:hypothetical protein